VSENDTNHDILQEQVRQLRRDVKCLHDEWVQYEPLLKAQKAHAEKWSGIWRSALTGVVTTISGVVVIGLVSILWHALGDALRKLLERFRAALEARLAEDTASLFREDMDTALQDIERIAAENPRLAPAPMTGPEGTALANLFECSCPLGTHRLADCDGILIDIHAD